MTAGWLGSTSPSVLPIPVTIGSFTIGVDAAATRSGGTIRATCVIVPRADGPAPWPAIEVAYANLDRFS